MRRGIGTDLIRRWSLSLAISALVFVVVGIALAILNADSAGQAGISGQGTIYNYDPPAAATTAATSVRAAAVRSDEPARRLSRLPTATPASALAAEGGEEFINLASRSRTRHILHGDKTGGGHMWPGIPGKTPFPQGWSGGQIMHAASDIATDPASRVVAQQGGRTVVEGTRGGIVIRVVTDGRDIITAYPVG